MKPNIEDDNSSINNKTIANKESPEKLYTLKNACIPSNCGDSFTFSCLCSSNCFCDRPHKSIERPASSFPVQKTNFYEIETNQKSLKPDSVLITIPISNFAQESSLVPTGTGIFVKDWKCALL